MQRIIAIPRSALHPEREPSFGTEQLHPPQSPNNQENSPAPRANRREIQKPAEPTISPVLLDPPMLSDADRARNWANGKKGGELLKPLVAEWKAEGSLSPQKERQRLDALAGIAAESLRLGGLATGDAQEILRIRRGLSVFAAEVFNSMASLADSSSHEEIRKLAPLYDVYHFLALGDETGFTKLDELCAKPDAPEEAHRLLQDIREDQLRQVNLGALEIWEAYATEISEQEDRHSNETIDGQFVQAFELFSGGRSGMDRRAQDLRSERALIAVLREKLEKGEALSLRQALESVAVSGEPAQSELAKNYLSPDCRRTESEIRGLLVDYVSELPPDSKVEARLFRETLHAAQQNRTLKSTYATYAWIASLSENAELRGKLKLQLDQMNVAGEGYASAALSEVFHGVTEIAVAGAVAAPLRLATLLRLEKMGVTGWRGVTLAMGVDAAAEGTALATIDLAKTSISPQAKLLKEPDFIAKTYGANVLMMGVLKPFARAGQVVGPRTARTLGMVAPSGAGLSTAGRGYAWMIAHSGGFSGMIAANRVNEAVGLVEAQPGGYSRTIHDLLGYIRFAAAHRALDHFSGGKLGALGHGSKAQAAVVEARVMAESQVKKLGHVVRGRKSEGPARGTPQFFDPQAEIIYRQFTQLTLSRAGFNGNRTARLIAGRRQVELREYLKSFGLEPVFAGKKFVAFQEVAAKRSGGLKTTPLTSERFKITMRKLVASPAFLLLGTAPSGEGGSKPSRRKLLGPRLLKESIAFYKSTEAEYQNAKITAKKELHHLSERELEELSPKAEARRLAIAVQRGRDSTLRKFRFLDKIDLRTQVEIHRQALSKALATSDPELKPICFELRAGLEVLTELLAKDGDSHPTFHEGNYSEFEKKVLVGEWYQTIRDHLNMAPAHAKKEYWTRLIGHLRLNDPPSLFDFFRSGNKDGFGFSSLRSNAVMMALLTTQKGLKVWALVNTLCLARAVSDPVVQEDIFRGVVWYLACQIGWIPTSLDQQKTVIDLEAKYSVLPDFLLFTESQGIEKQKAILRHAAMPKKFSNEMQSLNYFHRPAYDLGFPRGMGTFLLLRALRLNNSLQAGEAYTLNSRFPHSLDEMARMAQENKHSYSMKLLKGLSDWGYLAAREKYQLLSAETELKRPQVDLRPEQLGYAFDSDGKLLEVSPKKKPKPG